MPKLNVSRIVMRVNAQELIKRGKPVINASVEHFAKRGITQVGSSARFESTARTRAFIDKWGVQRISGDVNKTTVRRIRTVLTRGVEAGKSYDQVAKDIERVFSVAKGSRARAIARTEIARASNFSVKEGYKQAGIEQKEWQATQGGNRRESHQEMDGQIRDIDEDFDSPDGNSAPYPGEFGVASEDINCECGVLPVVNGKGLRGNRMVMFKSLERARVPYEKQLRAAMVAGFDAQLRAVMEEFNSMVDAT